MSAFEPEPEPEELPEPLEPVAKRRKIDHPSSFETGLGASWEDAIAAAREHPRAIPDWDSDAQHDRSCNCLVCETYYQKFALNLFYRSQQERDDTVMTVD